MKKSILCLSISITLWCAWLLVQKNRELQEIRARITLAEEARNASSARAAQEETWTRSLKRQLHQSWAMAQESAPTNCDLSASPTNRAVSKLFRDAMMKEALRAEAKIAVTKTVQKLFDAGLAGRLQLNDAQSANLRELLEQRASVLWEQMMVPLATGELTPTDMASTGAAIKQEIDDNAAQIRQLLGDDGYNTWQWFENTQPQRDDAKEFTRTADQSGLSLTADQQSQLLDVMTMARANFNYQYDIGDPSKLDFSNWNANFTNEKLNAYEQDTQQLNANIVQQAQGILTPEQSAQLAQFLAGRLLSAMVTVRGTQAMIAGNTP